jgi:DNA primase small subunit
MESDHQELEFDTDLLRQYFRFLFPSEGMYKWLTYYQPDITEDDQNQRFSEYFYKREFSFTLEGDIYCRYNWYRNEKEFKEDLIKNSPIKIDIGAVYNIPPKNQSTTDSKAFTPQEKELVFDIDMTDYDDVRTCCQEANVCIKWWKFMSIAVKIIDNTIREDFGYKHLLWVFSGRRGVHCWVCDESTRKLNNEARSAIANYLTVHVGNEMTSATALVEIPTHPCLLRAKDIIQDRFCEIMMEDQKILDDEKQRKKIVDMVSNPTLRGDIELNWNEYLNKGEGSKVLWQVFEKIVNKSKSANQKNSKGKQVDYLASAMFTFIYPRIDANVSKGINHLLKSPFCVHPKTGKICVPFDPKKVDEFDPTNCPTLSQSLREYDELFRLKSGDADASFTTVPCMKESLAVFNTFLKSLKTEYTTVTSKQRRLDKASVNPMQVDVAF